MTTRIAPAVVKELFDYIDGRLHWRLSRGRCGAGDPAGCEVYGRVRINIGGRQYPRARLVFAWHHGRWPDGNLVHKNRNLLDDHIENLQGLPKSTATSILKAGSPLPGIIGVNRTRRLGKWSAHIHLGTFDTPEAAHMAYQRAHAALHGIHSPYYHSIMEATGGPSNV